MKEIYIGAAYYPELWQESEVDKDIQRCKELGLNVLRVGEFAWGKMEPKEGEFHFEWLEKVVDKLYKNGIYTVMCTPTCTPPRWLLTKYEEVRKVTSDGIRGDVSSRCHVCKTSKIIREKNSLIVTKMAETFKGHKGIIGWQIDNELFPYDEGCFCPLCKKAFRAYLKDKYGTVEKLNEAWLMSRWSLTYDSFDDIQPPYPKQWLHPSLKTEWWNFQCEQIYSYIDEQAEILHKYVSVPVGTDMMMTNQLSYYKANRNLDVAQLNHYDPASDLPYTKFYYGFLRTVKDRPFWITETQVGWNGSNTSNSGARPVGNAYTNTWLPIAMGGQMNMYWLFRAHPNGHEIGHGALFSAAGRAYREAEEIKKASSEISECKSFLLSGELKSRIAMHYSSSAYVNFASAPLLEGFNYRNTVIKKFYDAFRHYNVDVIDTPHSLDGYEVLISPFVATVDENGLKERVIEWVKNGGTWIVGPMSDIMDNATTKYKNAPYSFLEELAGVYTKYQKPVENSANKAKWADGENCEISMCYDAYEPLDGTVSLANFTEGEFTGLSVITERKVGKGKVILLGSVPSHEALRKLVNIKPVAQASNNVLLAERTNGIIALESEGKEGFIVLDGKYKNVMDGKTYSGKISLAPHRTGVFEPIG